jgi:uncharacterized protein (DUF1778 family)
MKDMERKAVRLNLRLTASQFQDLKLSAQHLKTTVSALVRKGIALAIKEGTNRQKN